MTRPVTAQESPAAYSSCDDVLFMMMQEKTLDQYILGAGLLSANQAQTAAVTQEDIGDRWLIRAAAGSLVITVDISPGLMLEAALFQGISPVYDSQQRSGFISLSGATTLTFMLPEDYHYSLVIRKQHVSDPVSGQYTITAQYRNVSRSLPQLRDNSTNQPMSPARYRVNDEGIQVVQLPSASVYVHPEAVTTAASHGGRAAQVRFGPSYGVLIDDWASEIGILDGALSVRGQVDNQPRLYYWEQFNFAGDFLDGDLLNLVDGQRNSIQTDWQDIRGIWLMEDCLGVKFYNGHRFLADMTPQNRTVVLRGGLDAFEARFAGLGEQTGGRTVQMQWEGIPQTPVTYFASILAVEYSGDRHLAIQSSNLQVVRSVNTEIPDENQRVDITRHDSASTISLDWINLSRFELTDETLLFEFTDKPRGTTTRSGQDIQRVEALEDVIILTYKDAPNGEPGMQRLLLPRDESYLELVTPAGVPAFDGRALAGEAQFMPRALNNTGGDCYPVTTFLPEANCPPAGHPNPANGNLWYQVTDLIAYGHLLDLALVRNYNSRMAAVDGPFGPGWSTTALVDHRAAFQPELSARVVGETAAAPYLIGLDLTWAPRGIIRFITPTGSQHIFVADGSGPFTAGTLTTPSMPGWRLTHESIRGKTWVLTQDEGATFTFDRAGRLIEFGYPQEQRVITISYPRDIIPALENIPERPVVLSDAPNERQLELYYDADYHITRSVLRDLSLSPAEGACDAGCQETRYTYTAGRLTTVSYYDGTTAHYDYDAATGQMISHQDPRAPIYESMRYTYNVQSLALETAEFVLPDGSLRSWRHLETLPGGGETHTVRVTDENAISQTYTYRRTAGNLTQPGDSFTLVSNSSPLAGVDAFEDKPLEYQWENGLLTAVRSRLLQSNTGRNSTTYAYTPNGQIIHTGGGFETVRIAYTPDPLTRAPVYYPQSIQFDDGSRLAYTYDDQGRLETTTDQDGAIYRYIWGDNGLPVQTTRENDGTVWLYAYNAFGLVTEVIEQTPADSSAETAHRIRYTWNAFGNLLAVDDNTTGLYTLTYTVTTEDDQVFYDTVLTDPTGAMTLYRQNTRRLLLEVSVNVPGESTPLRRTTYAYDFTGRLTAESRWLYAEDGSLRPVVTTYTYTPITEMAAVPGEDPAFSRVVRGTQTTITLPGGQTRNYIVDALGRVRQTKDERNHIYRYHYSVSASQPYGLRIVQYEIYNNEITDTTLFDFDVRWQLRTIQRGDNTWTFLLDGDTTAVRFLQAPTVGIREMEWARDALGRVSDVTVRPLEIQLNSGNKTINTHLHVEYDFLGRAITQRDDTGRITAITYCPAPQGGYIRLQSHPGSSVRPECSEYGSPDVALAEWYDSADRLIQAVDEFGSRVITYTPNTQAHNWIITTAFTPVAEDGLSYQEERHQSVLGELLLWIDDAGTPHRYAYDTLGRLTAVNVDDNAEESFTLSYNDAGLLILEEDGLGRGTRYDYNRYGQLISQENLSTRFITSYDYGSNNLLRSITSPLGATTNYLYQDPANPQLLTGITTASGSAHHYDWDLDANLFSYTDPRGHQQTYTFDTLGYLWRVDDTLGRTHELHYDAIRRLTDWRQNQGRNAAPARHFAIEYNLAGDEIMIGAAGTDWRWHIALSEQGHLTGLSSPASHPIVFGYDALGRLSAIQTGSRIWSIARESGSRQIDYTDGFGYQRALGYDAANNLIDVTTADGSITYTYTPLVNQPAMTIEAQQAAEMWTYIFHAGNRADLTPPQVTLVQPGQAVIYDYNADGYLTTITRQQCLSTSGELVIDSEDPLACIQQAGNDETIALWQTNTRIMYDAEGRPIRFIDEEQNVAAFAYDENGNLLSYQNFNGQTTLYTYDPGNRLTSITGPGGIKLLLTYDGLDNLSGICRTRADAPEDYAQCANENGVIESASYDSLGRLVTQQYPTLANDGTTLQKATTQFSYATAGGGQITRQDSPGGSTSLTYSSDGLTQLNLLENQYSQYSVAYAGLDLLGQADATTYLYDSLGRVQRIDVDGHTLVYRYHADGQGYCIEDTQSGAAICPQTNVQGMLQSIAVQSSGMPSTPLVRVTYPSIDATTQAINVLLEWLDGATLSLNLDRRGSTRFAFSSFGPLTSQRTFTPNGLPQTLLVDHFLAQTADGYSTVVGYDDMDNPVIVRINERDGQLLYLSTYAYNAAGQFSREVRRYANGTQMTLTYHYVNNLLAQQRIEVLEPVSSEVLVIGTSSVFLPGILLVISSPSRRKRLTVLSVLLVIALLGGYLPSTLAQDTLRTTWVYHYRYDGAGNLMQITVDDTGETCAEFAYDSMNRLIQASSQAVTRQYGYDLHNNLVQIDNRSVIHNQTDSPMLFYEGNTPWFIGRTQHGASFFVARGLEKAAWLLNDGLKTPLGTVQGGQPSLWLFDPLGRVIFTESPEHIDTLKNTACFSFTPVLPSSEVFSGAVSVLEGMIWDPVLNLFFSEGRVYLPNIGRFLQRGIPNMAGDTYALDASPVPALPTAAIPAEYQGLSLLLEAWQRINTIPYQGMAETVQMRYLPGDATQQPGFTGAFDALDQAWYTQMQTLLELPEWMAQHYNLRGITVRDAMLTQHMGSFAGQRYAGSTQTTPLPPVAMFQTLSRLLDVPERLPLQSYAAFTPAPRPDLDILWQTPHPVTDLALAPAAMLEKIPQLMNTMGKNDYILDLLYGLSDLTGQTGQEWVEAMLNTVLPAPPEVPALNGEAWLNTWFEEHPLDITQDIRAQMSLSMPLLPTWYDIADSWGWLRSDLVRYAD